MEAYDLYKLAIRIKGDQPITIKKVAGWKLYKPGRKKEKKREK
jgi:hypothetical protein